MAKDKVKEFFSHDYHARSKLAGIQMKHGLEGIGFYWCFIEILHENGGSVEEKRLAGIAYEIHADYDMVKDIVHNYDLFIVKGGKITNDRVKRNLRKRQEVSEARQKAAQTRWSNQSGGEDTPAEGEQDSATCHARQEDSLPSCGVGGFLGADEKEQHEETVKWIKNWNNGRFEKFEAEACEKENFDEHPCWGCRGVFENVIDEASKSPFVRVGRQKIKFTDYARAVQWYLSNRSTLEVLADTLRDVNEKCEAGKVKNRQNYLITALYQAARMHGGGS